MYIASDYGVALGDAMRLSASQRSWQDRQTRPGADRHQLLFEDLRTLRRGGGRLNNKWTMQLTSNLHFAFVEEQ